MRKIIRIVLILIGIGLFFVFAAPLWAHILNIGNAVGMAGAVILIITGIFLNQFRTAAKHIKSKKAGKIIFNTGMTAVIAVTLSFFIALGSTVASSTTNADNQKTVIVLGCAVNGENPSLMLSYRIDSAYNYLAENPESVAILSGGQGSGESISEAQCMFNKLTEKGIDANRLYLEDKSTNTFENISFSKQIIEEENLSKDIAIASSDFHLKRATMIAKKQDLTAKRISAPAGYFLGPTSYVRDTLGVIKEFIF